MVGVVRPFRYSWRMRFRVRLGKAFVEAGGEVEGALARVMFPPAGDDGIGGGGRRRTGMGGLDGRITAGRAAGGVNSGEAKGDVDDTGEAMEECAMGTDGADEEKVLSVYGLLTEDNEGLFPIVAALCRWVRGGEDGSNVVWRARPSSDSFWALMTLTYSPSSKPISSARSVASFTCPFCR